MDIHTGLLRTFVNYGGKKFYEIGPRKTWQSIEEDLVVKGVEKGTLTLDTVASTIKLL